MLWPTVGYNNSFLMFVVPIIQKLSSKEHNRVLVLERGFNVRRAESCAPHNMMVTASCCVSHFIRKS